MCTGGGSGFYDVWTTTNQITIFLNNQWHMLTFTYNGSSCVWYIDGVVFETKQLNNMFWPNSGINAFYIAKHNGYYHNGNLDLFNGKLDNIRTYSRALTQDEVRALYNAKQ